MGIQMIKETVLEDAVCLVQSHSYFVLFEFLTGHKFPHNSSFV